MTKTHCEDLSPLAWLGQSDNTTLISQSSMTPHHLEGALVACWFDLKQSCQFVISCYHVECYDSEYLLQGNTHTYSHILTHTRTYKYPWSLALAESIVMVGRIRYCNDYGINESCRFGGSAEQAKKKKRECKSRFSQRSMRFCTLLLVFQLPLPSSFPLFTLALNLILPDWYNSLLLFTLCTLASPAFPTSLTNPLFRRFSSFPTLEDSFRCRL